MNQDYNSAWKKIFLGIDFKDDYDIENAELEKVLFEKYGY